MRLSLCLLTKDELEGCRHDVPLIDRSAFDEVYAVDGHSRDGTIQYLQGQDIQVHLQPRGSLNAAVIYAFEMCTTDAVVFFHPKGSIDPAYLKEFRACFDAGYELIVASRTMKGAHNEEDSRFLKPRKWFVLLLAQAASLMFRRRGNFIGDVLHGFRGMTKASFEQVHPAETGATIDLEMVVEAYRRNIPRIEFPVAEGSRLAGETHFRALPTGWKLLAYLLRTRFLR